MTNINNDTDTNVACDDQLLPDNTAQGDTLVVRHRKFRFKRNWWGYIFILPFFIIFLIFGLYPMILSVSMAFTDYKLFSTESNFVGLDNFIYLLQQTRFQVAISNTIIIWVMNFIPQMLFAFFFAVIFTSKRIRLLGKGAFKLIYYMPNIITATSVAIMFYALFSYPDGPVYQVLSSWGWIELGTNFYRDAWTARILVAFIQFWMWFGNSSIILAAGISGIDPALYEAAEVDGASNSRMFFSITLPLIKPIVLYSLITSLLGGLQMFDIPFLFLGGGPALSDGAYATETIAVYIYKVAFDAGGEQNYSLAAAASVILFIIACALSVVTFKMINGKKEGKSKRTKKIKGGVNNEK